MAGVEGVDEGVDSGAVGAVGHEALLADGGGGGVELGGVLVELEVAVGGIVGVDEGVEVGVDRGVLVVKVGHGAGLGNDADGGLLHGLDGGPAHGQGGCDGGGLLGGELGGVLACGADVIALQDPESVLAGGIPYGVGPAIVTDVGVLADAVSVDVSLFPEDLTVLGGEGGSVAAIARVEALLLQDLGVLGVNLLGSASRED